MKLSLAGKPGASQSNRPKQPSSTTSGSGFKPAFGLSKGSTGSSSSTSSTTSKAKKISVFGDEQDDEDDAEDGMPGSSKQLSKLEMKKRADPSRLGAGLGGEKGNKKTSASPSPASLLDPPDADSPSITPSTNTKTTNSRILAKMHAEAQAIDPTIFSYDEVYDNMKSAQQAAIEARKSASSNNNTSGDAPKYVSGLLKAAELRKKDRIRAEDKLIEREREKEGEDFKDKDAFVTQAYKEQQEELRRLEEEEQKKEEQAAKRPGGMSEYYKRELAQSEAIHEAAMKAAAAASTTASSSASTSQTGIQSEEARRQAELAAHGPRSEAAIAEEAAKTLGRKVTLNEEGQIVDKRELLTGGLNVKPRKALVQGPASGPPGSKISGGGGFFSMSISERKSAQEEIERKEKERKKREDEASIGMTGLTMAERQKISRERQSKELERQMILAQEKKRKLEEEKEKELEKKVKVRKNDETKIEEMKRKALERRMQKKKEEEEKAAQLTNGQ